ncbi:uncharacterized protein LOC143914572 [Arctopsyche grandis]|uniref:uncharacterized protein LOC143914572 n=1 Tax=Arctopsyche grandis TaxID=121162 RepID=UPI00406D64E2
MGVGFVLGAETGSGRSTPDPSEEPPLPPLPSRAFRSSANKLYKTMKRVRAALHIFANHFQVKPRRQRLTDAGNTPCHTPGTPQKRCRQLLGRTPTKLYSPFGIETPRYASDHFNDSRYYPSTPEHGSSPVRKHFKSKSHMWRLINTRPRSLFH